MDTFSFLSFVILNEIHKSRNQEPVETAIDFHIETTRVMDSASDGPRFARHFSLLSWICETCHPQVMPMIISTSRRQTHKVVNED